MKRYSRSIDGFIINVKLTVFHMMFDNNSQYDAISFYVTHELWPQN